LTSPSVDLLVRCKHDGTDDGTAPAVIRPARCLPVGLIASHGLVYRNTEPISDILKYGYRY